MTDLPPSRPTTPEPGPPPGRQAVPWASLALVAILAVAAVLRFTGINWDDFAHLHPDERFLTMVETGLRLPSGLSEFFDTARSPFNPNNVGYTFFVYGTFPIFLVRFLAEAVSRMGYDQVHLVGRAASAGFDLLALALIYALGRRLYGRTVGLLAALLGAFTVLLIQHAHFFVVDPFANALVVAGLFFAVRAQDEGRLLDYVAFGVSVGAAAASKISALPLAGVIVIVAAARVATTDPHERDAAAARAVGGLVAAGAAAFLSFRLLQPYAFEGPGALNILPNPAWLSNLREVRVQSSGDADLPFALQWADRPRFIFSFRNMILWGLGLPLGLVAWASWGWALAQSLRGRWRRHLVPLTWTGGFAFWQAAAFTASMRYQLPVYPTLILFAAWGSVSLWRKALAAPDPVRRRALPGLGVVSAILLAAHVAYGIGFTTIYARPVTRVAASRWIYANVPGAVNLVVGGQPEGDLYPLATSAEFLLSQSSSTSVPFTAQIDGRLTEVQVPRLIQLGRLDGPAGLRVELWDSASNRLAQGSLSLTEPDSPGQVLAFDPAPDLIAGQDYRLSLFPEGTPALALDGGIELVFDAGGVPATQSLPLAPQEVGLGLDRPLLVQLHLADLPVEGAAVGWPRRLDPSDDSRLTISLLDDPGSEAPLAEVSVVLPAAGDSPDVLRLRFPEPVAVDPERSYWLRLEAAGAPLGLRGARLINESSWDDGLPLRLDGRDAFGGIYTGLNQELYWADDEDVDANGVVDKLDRVLDTLDQGDYLVITSNRQYGTIPRVPVRYPLTTEYYRLLFECPAPQSVPRCGGVAEPTGRPGPLGYELVQVFQSNPGLGSFQINDQAAEEAFTVYDHPKVLIFHKTPSFSRGAVAQVLGAVDTSHVQHVIPSQAARAGRDLMLPADRLEEQRAGGTWSELFPRDSWVNRSEVLATVVWWLLILAIGWLALPIARAALPGFDLGAYALSRTLGLLLLAWAAWALGSLRLPQTGTVLFAVLLILGLASALLAYRDRASLWEYLRRARREIAWVELLALALFLIDLAIRLGNPDLWHPAKGGEKPMDFSYFNAVLRSTSFPPYDPWFAGGYINYYYFGFVVVGVPVRLLGLNPAVAYNLILPTLFALVGLGAFGLAFELVRNTARSRRSGAPVAAGVAAAMFIVLLGNLGTVRMGYEGLKRIGAGGEPVHEMVAGVPQALRGLGRFLTLQSPLPYRPDEWYWNPSRAIPAEPGDVDPITEFPFFTFLYADLHAHMISLPLTVLGLAWAASWLLTAVRGGRPRGWRAVAVLGVGGLILGSLRATNTWDFPVYLGLGAVAVGLAPVLEQARIERRSLLAGAIGAIGLLAAALVLYLPYTTWYVQGYTQAEFWDGSRTTLRAYLTVHGVFLFFLSAWMVHEAIDWMATTPYTALIKVRDQLGWILAASILILAAEMYAWFEGVRVVAAVLPLGLLAGLLLLRRNLPLEKRLVLGMALTGLALTLVVELVRLQGDIGRMNTVFKFYLQVWTLFSIGSAAALIWAWIETPRWAPGLAAAWRLGGVLLVTGAALYPLTATPAKIRDRMASDAPHTLDGTAFMQQAVYYDQGGEIRLEEDYLAIRWLQDKVQGSPVIAEANIPEYRWGTRATIYTGLPGVIGWNWHQRQQRPLVAGDPVTARALDLLELYANPSQDRALEILDRYQVAYVIVGGLERLYFERVQPCWPTDGGASVDCDMAGKPVGMRPPQVPAAECRPIEGDTQRLSCPTHGLEKFEAMTDRGALRAVYQEGQTTIYEVVR